MIPLVAFVLVIFVLSTLLSFVWLLDDDPVDPDNPFSEQKPFWEKVKDIRKPPKTLISPDTGNLPPNYLADHSGILDMRQLVRTLPFDNLDGGAWKQGWEVSPKSGPLQVVVVPHSHCDPGWIKTFDEYFRQQTTHILSTVVDALSQDERRTFIWAEISYLSWWWEEATEMEREKLKTLLRKGQFEIVTGGWVMPDEANSHIDALEMQMEEGHDWIREHLGEEHLPKYGWSIDPFGYSPTQAYLLQKLGFKGMLIQRVHYHIKKVLARAQALEFKWRQVWDPKGDHDILTHTMPFFSYDVPHTCGPDPSVCCQFDFGRRPVGIYQACPWHKNVELITDSNVADRAKLLIDQYRKKAALYQHNVVFIPLGDDFRYDNAREATNQFENHQKLHDYINRNMKGVSIRFGTLKDYFEAVEALNVDFPVLEGSFFTYSDVNEDYWSGYYTSRAFDKALDRQLERTLFVAKSLGGTRQELQGPRRALSLFQHHDGVTGTAKTNVVEDYAKRMFDAIHETQAFIRDRLKEKVIGWSSDYAACWQASRPRSWLENHCGDTSEVVVYNPLETEQYCGDVRVPGKAAVTAHLPCDPSPSNDSVIKFDPETGLMTSPIREEWKEWKVKEGGAYLFFPDKLVDFDMDRATVEQGGYLVSAPHWSRRVVQQRVATDYGTTALVIDFIYEIHVTMDNEEWFVRFHGDVNNKGVFHTDLNGLNFDTHYFRSDMPIQSQVYPMPLLASIEDANTRMTVLSEHSQGTASLEDGSIDVFLDRRLRQDDSRGLGQGVRDTAPTRTRMRVVIEHEGYKPDLEFQPTLLCQRMWDELQHPLEIFGRHVA